jgi:hypothetical protein
MSLMMSDHYETRSWLFSFSFSDGDESESQISMIPLNDRSVSIQVSQTVAAWQGFSTVAGFFTGLEIRFPNFILI